jgi:hypothetical protein
MTDYKHAMEWKVGSRNTSATLCDMMTVDMVSSVTLKNVLSWRLIKKENFVSLNSQPTGRKGGGLS